MCAAIKIGSRGSKLALWQANFAQNQLREIGLESEIIVIKTQGDRVQHLSLDKLEGKGFFTKELEDSLLDGRIDLAIHSHKDLPTESPKGLMISAVSYREDPADTILIRSECYDPLQLYGLPVGAVVGTSSARRKAQLLENCPSIVLKDIRGNVPTRIQKLQKGEFDAILLAQAGLNRLQLDPAGLKVITMRVDRFVPAPAQGVLAYQVRESDIALHEKLQQLHHSDVGEAIAAERKLLALFEGGCHMPLGAHCRKRNGVWEFFVAQAERFDGPLRNLYLRDNKSPANFASIAFEQLSKVTAKRVFISRDLTSENPFVQSLSRHGIPTRAESLIAFEAIPFNLPSDADWLFFSSRTAVHQFAKLADFKAVDFPGLKIAAIGSGTARSLLQAGWKVDFTANPFDLKNSLQSYLELAKGQKVVFPSAKNSLRSVQKQAQGKIKVVDLPVYDNKPKETIQFPIEEEIVVLTSPMNARVFAAGNGFNETQQLIAIGPTTAAELKTLGAQNVHTSRRPGEFALLESIWSFGL